MFRCTSAGGLSKDSRSPDGAMIHRVRNSLCCSAETTVITAGEGHESVQGIVDSSGPRGTTAATPSAYRVAFSLILHCQSRLSPISHCGKAPVVGCRLSVACCAPYIWRYCIASHHASSLIALALAAMLRVTLQQRGLRRWSIGSVVLSMGQCGIDPGN